MMQRLSLAVSRLLIGWLLLVTAQAQTERWSAQKANDWYQKQGWLVGCNFIPSTAINELEMWQADTFDPTTIDRELGMAEGLGMNIVRVYLHNLLWENDSTAFNRRIDQFLTIADRHHIRVMFVLFDSCWNDDPKLGQQPDPKPGVHNSGWVRAPGTKRMFDSRTWAGLEAYVKGVVGTYASDPRVLIWDVFNEPSNSGYMDAVVPLLKKSFEWTRAAKPTQPITAGWWHSHPLSNEVMFGNSDIITFHNYLSPSSLKAQIEQVKRDYGRPVICTEYMSRGQKSTFEGCLPIFKQANVGAISWGLVKGKTNTIYSWYQKIPSGEEPSVWFHDIYRPDGTPFSAEEVTFLRKITGVSTVKNEK